MRIEQIGAYSYGSKISRARQREDTNQADKRKSKSHFAQQDTYEPSSGQTGKASSIKEVQKRVRADFYKSDVVNEDLSEIFAKLFDR